MAILRRQPAADTASPQTGATSTIQSALPESRTAVKTRRRPLLAALGAAAILASGLTTWFVVEQSQTQNEVVQVRADVPRGATIEASDLSTTTVGSIAGLSSVPASQLQSLVGQHATVDLKAGSLLPAGVTSTQTMPEHDHTVVGLSLAPGRVPFGEITPGSKIRLVVTSAGQTGQNSTDDQQTGQVYEATMVSTSSSTIQGTGTIVNVDVLASQAPQIAMMSASNRLALVKDSDR